VSDTGPGIRTPDGQLATPEQIERVFDLGYTTKTDGEGEGLGLNWVRTILTEFHTGDLVAYNRPEGGATFQFSLPLAKSGNERDSQRFEADALSKG
jgi:signal transduction histidine kinase